MPARVDASLSASIAKGGSRVSRANDFITVICTGNRTLFVTPTLQRFSDLREITSLLTKEWAVDDCGDGVDNPVAVFCRAAQNCVDFGKVALLRFRAVGVGQ